MFSATLLSLKWYKDRNVKITSALVLAKENQESNMEHLR